MVTIMMVERQQQRGKIQRSSSSTLLFLVCLLSFAVSSAHARSIATVLPVLRSRQHRKILQKQQTIGKEIRLSLPQTVTIGCILCLHSGFLNGCCLQQANLPVVAVTSSYTKAALQQSSKTWWHVIFAYMSGSAVAGMLLPHPVAFSLTSSSSTAVAMALAAAAVVQARVTTTLAWAAVAAGIQNSITSVHTANLVRSAHMSGLTSDMGTFIGQWMAGNSVNLYKAKIAAALLASFTVGGALSLWVGGAWNPLDCLWVSAGFYAVVALALVALQF